MASILSQPQYVNNLDVNTALDCRIYWFWYSISLIIMIKFRMFLFDNYKAINQRGMYVYVVYRLISSANIFTETVRDLNWKVLHAKTETKKTQWGFSQVIYLVCLCMTSNKVILNLNLNQHLSLFSSSAHRYSYIWSLSRIRSGLLHGDYRSWLQRYVLLWWTITSRKHDLAGVMPEWSYIGHQGNASSLLCACSGVCSRRAWRITCLCDVVTESLSWCDGIFSRKWG